MTALTSHPLFWIIAAPAGAILVIWLAAGAIAAIPKALDWLRNARRRLGMESLPLLVFFFVAVMWSGLALTLFMGLGMLVLCVLWQVVPNMGDKAVLWEFRFKLAQLAVLTTVLGAVIALPITLTKLRLAREAGETAKDSLFNDKITEAAADLYAQRQVTKRNKKEGHYQYWEDDIVRRNAAIDRLFGLAEERPSEARRVSRMLSTYLRQLSRDFPPRHFSEDDFKPKADNEVIAPVRADMNEAVKTIGKLAGIKGVHPEELQIDLRGSNLQGVDLRECKFVGANFSGAFLQGADLWKSELIGCMFLGSELQGTRFGRSKILGTRFSHSNLSHASLDYSDFEQVSFADAVLTGANFQGSFFQNTEIFESGWDIKAKVMVTHGDKNKGPYFNGCAFKDMRIPSFISGSWGELVFADGSVDLGPLVQRSGAAGVESSAKRQKHWPEARLSSTEFEDQHSKWLRSRRGSNS
jgi:uncharacterized protein YjbI with pentapeptide repeats